jgi:hypothetical protein
MMAARKGRRSTTELGVAVPRVIGVDAQRASNRR